MARDEAIQRATTEKQANELALETVRAELSEARAARQQIEQRLQKLTARESWTTVEDPSMGFAGTTRGRGGDAGAETAVEETQAPARRRGRPRKVSQLEPDSDIVEWWKPGWQDRFR